MTQQQLKLSKIKILLDEFSSFTDTFERNHPESVDIQFKSKFSKFQFKIKILGSIYMIKLDIHEKENEIFGVISFYKRSKNECDNNTTTLCSFDKHGNYAFGDTDFSFTAKQVKTKIDSHIIEAYLNSIITKS